MWTPWREDQGTSVMKTGQLCCLSGAEEGESCIPRAQKMSVSSTCQAVKTLHMWERQGWMKHKLESRFSSVSQSCPTLCNPMNHSMPGFPVQHQLPELTQTHVHWMVMPSNHLSLCSSLLLLQSFPASGSFQMSQFFVSGGQNIGDSASASVLPMNIQDWFPLGWTGCISLLSKGLSRVFSNTTVQKHQFFCAQLSL